MSLVSFELGSQEYALPLDRVREIIPLPEQVSQVPRPETAVLGVVTLRDRLLPLVSLRALLGLPPIAPRGAAARSWCCRWAWRRRRGGRSNARNPPRRSRLIDPAPALLTRGAGEAEIASICRLDHGKRLVALLSPDRLFRSELVKRVLSEQTATAPTSETELITMADEQFIIFRLGDQEYGLPIAAVERSRGRPSTSPDCRRHRLSSKA